LKTDYMVYKLLAIMVGGFACASSAQAGVIYSRLLPNSSSGGVSYTNASAAATSSLANYGFTNLNGYTFSDDEGVTYTENLIVGDTFTLGASGGAGDAWTADSISVWVIGTTEVNATGDADSALTPDLEWTNGLTLYVGDPTTDTGALVPVSTSYTYERVYYSSDESNYQSLEAATYGNYYAIWKLTFSFGTTGLTLNSGETYGFGVYANGSTTAFQIHATNCPYAVASGVAASSEQGCDSMVTQYFWTDGVTADSYTAALSEAQNSDINIEISGTAATPEPMAWLLIGSGLVTLGLFRRHRHA